ncbi:cytidylate kinase [Diaporthe helianthi]|uniref:Cytidylate kinase n=1 Tax=Diaporthe helianthi TaxID=158607 RepID=A0A2P5IF35_DIAHE|nr:cytidylate kinase [Diaporthe helianthi]
MDKYLDSMLPFLSVVEAVKTIPRKGWQIRGVPEPEHVGDHMHRMALICMAHPKFTDSDKLRAIQLALVHDAGEAIVGDITPKDGISREQKALRENLAFKFFDCLIRPSNPGFAAELAQLWREYEDKSTEISRFVNQVDKFECVQQAAIYDKRYRGKIDLDDFRSLTKQITDPWLSAMAEKTIEEWDANKARRKSTPCIIFVVGGPGVGKGTQCSLAAKEFNLGHLSLGDLLRAERSQSDSVFGEFIDESMNQSVVFPALLSMLLLKGAVEAALAEGKAGVLLDGFPRSVEQASAFEEEIAECYSTISLECSTDAMVERIKTRASSGSARPDDDPEVVARRLDTFNKSNASVTKHLQAKAFHTIDCSGAPDEVHVEMKKLVQQILTESKSTKESQ